MNEEATGHGVTCGVDVALVSNGEDVAGAEGGGASVIGATAKSTGGGSFEGSAVGEGPQSDGGLDDEGA